MNVRHVLALLGVVAAAAATGAQPSSPQEENVWPFFVRHQDDLTGLESMTGAGPFLFRKPNADEDGNTASGFRPVWVQFNKPSGEYRYGTFLYPIFSYSLDQNTYHWSFFALIRSWGLRANAAELTSTFDRRGEFEIFPIWFSRETGDPEMSYRALFPIYGTVKNKLTFERLSWTLFPLYVEITKRGAITTSTPWPIIRRTRGAAHGWGVWPIFNFVDRPGVSRHETYLWPFGYNAIRHPSPDDPPGTPPRRDIGVLPFYARSTGPGYIYEDFLWPFFGYAERSAPNHLRERHYLWPLFVQSRGENRYINRWAPFYSHSNVKGYEKRWFLWPLFRQGEWTDRDVTRTRTQLLYFAYWNEEQRPVGRVSGPSASLTHIWPLFSHWHNGMGREQWQLFSPFDILFPRNDRAREVWSPLAAIIRHERRAPGDARTSLFWNAITWEKQSNQERGEFHLGPLLGVTRNSGERRVSFGNGLFGFRRSSGDGWRMFWLDFPSKPATNPSPPR